MKKTGIKKILIGSFCIVTACAALAQAVCFNTVSCNSTYHGLGSCVPSPGSPALTPPAGEANPEGWELGSFACGVVKFGTLLPIPCGAGTIVDTCHGGEPD